MIQCPKCAQQLPDWSQVCQFCQTDLKGVPRPKADPKSNHRPLTEPAKWIWPVYYIICGYYILSGMRWILTAVLMMSATKANAAGEAISGFAVIGIVVGVITLLIGIGLAARVEFVRGIVNFFCFLQILSGLMGIGGSLLGGMLVGPAALIGLIFSVFDIVTAGLMIYLIGETD